MRNAFTQLGKISTDTNDISVLDLLQKSARTEQIESVPGGEQGHAQAEVPATVAIPGGQDCAPFEGADAMRTDEAVACESPMNPFPLTQIR